MRRRMASFVAVPLVVVCTECGDRFIIVRQRQKLRLITADHADFRRVVIVVFVVATPSGALRFALRLGLAAWTACPPLAAIAPPATAPPSTSRAFALRSFGLARGRTALPLGFIGFVVVVMPGVAALGMCRLLVPRRIGLIPMVKHVVHSVLGRIKRRIVLMAAGWSVAARFATALAAAAPTTPAPPFSTAFFTFATSFTLTTNFTVRSILAVRAIVVIGAIFVAGRPEFRFVEFKPSVCRVLGVLS